MTDETRSSVGDDPVVGPEQVAILGPVRLLDVRSPEMHQADAVPGSVRVPIEEWVSAAASDQEGLHCLTAWEDRIAALGIGGDTLALVYDGGEMTEAARVWFVLQHFGARALVVNGGRPALDGTALPPPAPAPYTAFRARPASGAIGLIEREEIREHLGDVAIFDARTDAEFSGDDLKTNTRGGHLPGARLLPHQALLRDGCLLPPDALRRMILDAGLRPGEALVTHCQGGGRAALAAIAALRAGFDDVRVYYRSFGDWAADESCPIER